jgi:hypothetical protein
MPLIVALQNSVAEADHLAIGLCNAGYASVPTRDQETAALKPARCEQIFREKHPAAVETGASFTVCSTVLGTAT